MTIEVEAAIRELNHMGPRSFPALAKHLGDDRYSYSIVSAAWVNLSVSGAILRIFCDGGEHWMYNGYKTRQTPSGPAMLLSFEQYFNDRGRERWAEWASAKTRLAIQEDFIEWCVGQENKRGYIDEKQRKHVLDTYEQARKRVRAEYSEPRGSADGSQPARPGTNPSPGTAGSRR